MFFKTYLVIDSKSLVSIKVINHNFYRLDSLQLCCYATADLSLFFPEARQVAVNTPCFISMIFLFDLDEAYVARSAILFSILYPRLNSSFAVTLTLNRNFLKLRCCCKEFSHELTTLTFGQVPGTVKVIELLDCLKYRCME